MTLLVGEHIAVRCKEETAVRTLVVPLVANVIIEVVDVLLSPLAFRLDNCLQFLLESGFQLYQVFRIVCA